MIYQWVWKDKRCGGKLYKYLRHRGKKYRKRMGVKAGRSLIPGRVDIDERPAIVDTKTRIGDFEADTIVGANHQGAIVSLVDRKSKYSKLVLVKDSKAETVSKAILSALKHEKLSHALHRQSYA